MAKKIKAQKKKPVKKTADKRKRKPVEKDASGIRIHSRQKGDGSWRLVPSKFVDDGRYDRHEIPLGTNPFEPLALLISLSSPVSIATVRPVRSLYRSENGWTNAPAQGSKRGARPEKGSAPIPGTVEKISG